MKKENLSTVAILYVDNNIFMGYDFSIITQKL